MTDQEMWQRQLAEKVRGLQAEIDRPKQQDAAPVNREELAKVLCSTYTGIAVERLADWGKSDPDLDLPVEDYLAVADAAIAYFGKQVPVSNRLLEAVRTVVSSIDRANQTIQEYRAAGKYTDWTWHTGLETDAIAELCAAFHAEKQAPDTITIDEAVEVVKSNMGCSETEYRSSDDIIKAFEKLRSK